MIFVLSPEDPQLLYSIVLSYKLLGLQFSLYLEPPFNYLPQISTVLEDALRLQLLNPLLGMKPIPLGSD